MTFIPPRPDDNGCCPHCGQEMNRWPVPHVEPKAWVKIRATFGPPPAPTRAPGEDG